MSGRDYSLYLSSRGREDLNLAVMYSLEMWGEDQQAAYEQVLLGTLRRIQTFPESGRRMSIRGVDVRRAVAGRHIIYYELTGNTIEVLRILHERQHVSRDVLFGED